MTTAGTRKRRSRGRKSILPREKLEETLSGFMISDAKETLLKKLKEFCNNVSKAYNLVAPTTLTVMKSSGEFRKRPFNVDEEFLFAGGRYGSRGEIILMFKPFETSEEIELVEVMGKELFERFPSITTDMHQLLGNSPTGIGSILAEHKLYGNFTDLCDEFIRNEEKRREEERKKEEKMEALKEEEKSKEQERFYQDHPLWGMFG